MAKPVIKMVVQSMLEKITADRSLDMARVHSGQPFFGAQSHMHSTVTSILLPMKPKTILPMEGNLMLTQGKTYPKQLPTVP